MVSQNGLIFTIILLLSIFSFKPAEAAENPLLFPDALANTPSQIIDHQQAAAAFLKPLDSLSEAVLLYESIQNSGRWQPFTEGPMLKYGDRHAQVSQLKEHLLMLGDLPKQDVFWLASQYFDQTLKVALMRFQSRHSVKADGVLGPQTRQLLNVPPWQRIDQLALNIHRQQQLRDTEEVYLHVNLPEYRLRLYLRDEVVLEMKTVIGKRTRQTPVFSAMVSRMVVNPDWNVPKSIAFKDILPRLRKDEEYLLKKNLRILSGWSVPQVEVAKEEIDLDQMYRGTDYYRFWEPPGKNNTLGRIKFQLTSDNSIYLHDTQQRHLFGAQNRAFSSGCIRLERARDLADVLVQISNQWQPEILGQFFNNEELIQIRLNKPVPIHVTYWTAWVDQAGVLNFANDIYRRDSADFAELQLQQIGMLAD